MGSRWVEPSVALRQYYATLLDRFGPQGWWPAHTRLEIILGAILTQNTARHNAVLALKRLRQDGLLGLVQLRKVSRAKLQPRIRAAGFFRQKARTIRDFLDWLGSAYNGSLNAMFASEAASLRRELLALKGLGPETADAILLYAGRKPFFVADAYTRRILARHEQVPRNAGYAMVQHFLHRHLPPDPALFNEYHALLVEVGKRYCKRQAPRCDDCPLKEFLPTGQAAAAVA
jgi:endonuclease-3 related protein